MLSQSRPHPSGLSVRDIVTYGRHPYRGRFAGLTDLDRHAVDTRARTHRPHPHVRAFRRPALRAANCSASGSARRSRRTPVCSCSTSQQITSISSIRSTRSTSSATWRRAEPPWASCCTTSTRPPGVADDVVLLASGRVLAPGTPEEVLTGEHLSEVYGLPIDTLVDADNERVRVLPRARHRLRPRRPEPEFCTI